MEGGCDDLPFGEYRRLGLKICHALSQTLHGTAIHADQLTPQTTPMWAYVTYMGNICQPCNISAELGIFDGSSVYIVETCWKNPRTTLGVYLGDPQPMGKLIHTFHKGTLYAGSPSSTTHPAWLGVPWSKNVQENDSETTKGLRGRRLRSRSVRGTSIDLRRGLLGGKPLFQGGP